ncbi:MAG: hypothetical protein AAF696_25785, partial [Bacteroidota bacterium]
FFLSKNSLPTNYVEEVGNLAYQGIFAGRTEASHTTEDTKNLLWCTTLKIHAEREYKLMEKALLALDIPYKLFVRLHPRNHISKEEILALLHPEIKAHTHFDNIPRIKDSFSERDLVICTSISTSYIDSLMQGKSTCSIMPEAAWDVMPELAVIPFYHFIQTADEFERALNRHQKPKSQELDILEVISYMKPDRWEAILGNHTHDQPIRIQSQA